MYTSVINWSPLREVTLKTWCITDGLLILTVGLYTTTIIPKFTSLRLLWLLLLSVGYVLVAFGAKKLQKIEEV